MAISVTGIIVDLITISIMISTIYLGYRRGLTGVIYKILASVISLIIVFSLYKPVSNTIITNTNIDESIALVVKDAIPSTVLEEEKTDEKEEANGISEYLVGMMQDYATEAVAKAENDIASYVSIQIAYFIIRIGTIVILFVASRVILIVLKFATSIISSLPIISSIDKSGGLVYGIIKAFLIVYVIFAIISACSPIISSWGIISAIQKSYLGSVMYNNNFILNLIMK